MQKLSNTPSPIALTWLKWLSVFVSIVVVTSLLPLSPLAYAISGSDFSAGHIIDDDIFTNSNAMSVQDIQNFLTAKVGSCDNAGTRLTDHWNGDSNSYYTDGQWAAKYGQSPTFTCINQYVENTSTFQNNFGNYLTQIPGAISAAQIIYNAAQQYKINPEVILATLQKEQGVVTDYWPWLNEYQYAMGYDCPDGSGCNSQYADFYKQVDSAGWQFRYYLNNPGMFNYWLGNNFIPYNANSNCGGSVVNIENPATAALYIYTPYQPNQAALSKLNDSSSGGTGDSCSAYGNRDFWWYFNEWFGSSIDATDATDTPPDQTRAQTVVYNGQIYVFYYDAYRRVLCMATQNTKTGHWQTVVLDGNNNGGGGTINASLGSDIAVTVYNNTLQLFYYNKSAGTLRHAWYNGTTWLYEDLDGTLGSVSGLSGNVGLNPSVTVYNNTLQLFYYNKSAGTLRHAWTDSTGWHFENLDGDAHSISGLVANVGLMSAVTSLSNNSLQVFYADTSAGTLRHAWTDSTGWHFENLDGDAHSISGGSASVGMNPTVVNYNSSNYLQLFYYDTSEGLLRHAWTDSTGWHFENLDGSIHSVSHEPANVGVSAVATSFDGNLQLFYYDVTNGNLRHAWTQSDGWHFENLDGDPHSVVGNEGDIGMDPTATTYGNSLQLYYFNRTSGSLEHTWADSSGWHNESLESTVIY